MYNLLLILKRFLQYDLGLNNIRGKIGQCSTCFVSGERFSPPEHRVKHIAELWFKHNVINATSLQENTYITTFSQRGVCATTEEKHAPSVVTHMGISRIPTLRMD